MFSALGSLQPRQLLTQVLNFALVLSTAFMLWKGLSVATDSPSPIVVVLSGSMEPAFQRGDLLFLWNRGQDTQIGEIVVYNVRGKDIPIVHRVVRRYGGGDTPLKLLTKGDNNIADDTELYARGQDYLERSKDIIGSVGGKFEVHATLPNQYPFKPPVINWKTKIYHPNVTNDGKGTMCLGFLRDGEWKPSSRMSTALEYVRQLMLDPVPEDAVEQAVANEYNNNKKQFIKTAKLWTKTYAGGPG
ncbi:MAG: hypothetical protein Q9176_006727 [Flavoplaca citrina]